MQAALIDDDSGMKGRRLLELKIFCNRTSYSAIVEDGKISYLETDLILDSN
jgi:hypothetical protein